ncbi:MAG: hypothetical protein AB7K09_07260 [Planctomycetota bacterium]
MTTLTDIQLAIVLDADGVFAHDADAFADAACELLLSPAACVAARRLLDGGRATSPVDLARFAALADSEGAFAFAPADLRRIFTEPALFSCVVAALHPSLATPAAPARRARVRHIRRSRNASAGVWAGVAAAAAVLLVAALVALNDGSQSPRARTSNTAGNDHVVVRPINTPLPTANNSPPVAPHNNSGAVVETPPVNHRANDPGEVIDHNAPVDDGGTSTNRPTPPINNSPAPRDPVVNAPANQPNNSPGDTVEHPTPTPTPTPTDPVQPVNPPVAPQPVLSIMQIDGRCELAGADHAALDTRTTTQLTAGCTINLGSGSVTLAFINADATTFGRIVLHGRTELRLDADATAAAPMLDLASGELLIDTTALPGRDAGEANFALRVGHAGHHLHVTRANAEHSEPFVGTIDCSRTRLTVSVIAGGACATLGGQSLASAAAARLALRDGDVDISPRRDGQPLSAPAWVAREFGESVLVSADFEIATLADGWDGQLIAEPRGRDGQVNHVLRLGAGTPDDPPTTGMQRAGVRFAHPDEVSRRLPNLPGLVLHLRIRAEKACTLTVHFFDGAIRENYSVDLPLRTGWQQLDLPLTSFRSRGDGSAPTADQRFQNISIITPLTGGAVDVDDLRLVRELR